MKKALVFSVLCLFVVALVGCGPKIGKEDAKKMYIGAVDAWAKDFKAAKAEERGKVDFTKYLNEHSKKAGAKDWADYCLKASQSMGAEEWNKAVQEFTALQTEKMKKLSDEIVAEATKAAGGGGEEKGGEEKKE